MAWASLFTLWGVYVLLWAVLTLVAYLAAHLIRCPHPASACEYKHEAATGEEVWVCSRCGKEGRL